MREHCSLIFLLGTPHLDTQIIGSEKSCKKDIRLSFLNLAFPNFVITLHIDPSSLPFATTHMMTSNSPGTHGLMIRATSGKQLIEERGGTRRDVATALASLPPPPSIAIALIATSQHRHHPNISIIRASASSQHQHRPSISSIPASASSQPSLSSTAAAAAS